MKIDKTLSIRTSLATALWASMPVQVKPAPVELVVHGPKVRVARAHPTCKEPDEVILEVRRLSESENAKPKEIHLRLLAHGFDLTRNRIIQIRQYATRAHLVPSNTTRSYLEPKE